MNTEISKMDYASASHELIIVNDWLTIFNKLLDDLDADEVKLSILFNKRETSQIIRVMEREKYALLSRYNELETRNEQDGM